MNDSHQLGSSIVESGTLLFQKPCSPRVGSSAPRKSNFRSSSYTDVLTKLNEEKPSEDLLNNTIANREGETLKDCDKLTSDAPVDPPIPVSKRSKFAANLRYALRITSQ